MSIDTENFDIIIFSDDPILCRTVIAEASRFGLSTDVVTAPNNIENAKVCVVDLDSHSKILPLISSKRKAHKNIIGVGYNTHTTNILDALIDSEDLSGRQSPYKYCDFVLKRPFLLAKLRQAIKTLMPTEESVTATAPSLPILDRDSMSVLYCGKTVSLSPNECLILELLLSRTGTAVSRDEIAGVIGESSSNKVDVYVCYLRRKLEGVSDTRLIKSVRNIGYIIE